MKLPKIGFTIGNFAFNGVHIIMTMVQQRMDTGLYGEDLTDPCKQHVDRHVYLTWNL